MNKPVYHPITAANIYATVILPLAVGQTFTYYVPGELIKEAAFGKRVEVQFGKNKLYAALIIDIHREIPKGYKAKPILSVIDPVPIVNRQQLDLWKWMASYYTCTLGEIMLAALPGGFKLSSETRIILSPVFDYKAAHLKDKEYLVAEALQHRPELSIDDLRKLLQQKTIYPLVQGLLEKKMVYLKEELKTKYKPKKIACVRLQEPYAGQPDLLEEAFEKLSRSTRQVEALMAYIQLSRQQEVVRKQDVYKKANVDSTVLNAIVKKGIFELYEKEVSRLGTYEEELTEVSTLADQQTRALAEIDTAFADKNVVLLHGVTGSGKTRVYIELIQETVRKGGQVLYLVPEIALTTQLTTRLQRIFGEDIAVYHSRLNNNERIDLWKAVLGGKPIVMAARSGLFLPFSKLQLIIVDEEHDSSFKQQDPAPRYNARDAAIYLAGLFQAKVVLGTATPSLESYYNTKLGKYAYIVMPERFGGVELPEMVIVDKRLEFKERKMQAHFTSMLIEELTGALARGEQAIIFQNRRGYAPSIHCPTCAWHLECVNCDVSLTYHKHSDNMRCHYCGYQTVVPSRCPSCGASLLQLRGYGTEKVEDELKIYFPEAKIARMDLDTARGKLAHARILNDFEERRIDILVGTQMVTKGLDFDNVGIVGVLSADHILQFPDFRACERTFQLITQVAGRAGRKKRRGKVIIQAFNISHPVLKEIIEGDWPTFSLRELAERKDFHYPPFLRLINVTLKHQKPQTVNEAMKVFYEFLHKPLGKYIIGPSVPPVARVRNQYLLQLMVKLPKNARLLVQAKTLLREATHHMRKVEGCSSVRVNIDVDPS